MNSFKKLSLAALFLSTYANAGDILEVDYNCSGKPLRVSYVLMNEAVAQSALVRINGIVENFQLDVYASDDVSMSFKNDSGYLLSTTHITTKTYKNSTLILTDPNNRILFKNCSVKSLKGNEQKKTASKGYNVSYNCSNNKKINVNYQFNNAGLPKTATAILGGKSRVLPIDLKASDDISTTFSKNGYVISTDAMDKNNFYNAGLIILAPKNKILYKNCTAEK